MASKLTAATVENLKGGVARREILDGGCPGLYLIVQPSGAKSWAMRFRRPNRVPVSKLTLGPLAPGKGMSADPDIGKPLTIKAARKLAAKINHQRDLGVDVIGEHAAAKHRRRIETEEGAANTFPVLVARYVSEYARKQTRRWYHTARYLGLHYPKNGEGGPEIISKGLCDRWANKPVTTIDGSDIYTIVNETQHLGVPGWKRQKTGQQTDGVARSMFAALSGFFGWCVEHRKVGRNPCTGGYRPKPPKKKRDRVLTNDEIVKFWQASHEIGEPIGQALRLLLLTGCRLDEVREMQRSELSEDGTWNLPGERTKNRLPHIVPLPPLARDILASVKPIAGKFVFTLSGKKPIAIGSTRKHALDAIMDTPAWRLHDLRRTAATGMAGIGIAPHVVEAALNHVSGVKAGIAGTYNVYAYAPEKRAALERWASHVEGLVSGKPTENVVQLSGKRGKK